MSDKSYKAEIDKLEAEIYENMRKQSTEKDPELRTLRNQVIEMQKERLADLRRKELDALKKQLELKKLQKAKAREEAAEKKPEIIIDGYKFRLDKKILWHGRDIIFLTSINPKTGEEKRIWFYTSNSQGGTWRYCFVKPKTSYLEKGRSYTATTMAHFGLQEFINNNLTRVPTVTETYPEKEIGEYFCANERDFKQVDSDFRHLGPKVFAPLKYFKPAEIFTNLDALLRFMDVLKTNMNSGSAEAEYYKGMRNALLEAKRNRDIDNEITAFKVFSQAVGIYFNNYFNVPAIQTDYGHNNFNIDNVAFFEVSYKSLPIQRKTNPSESYDVYFALYKYTNKKNPKFNGRYSIPLLVTPRGAKITAQGVYNELVDPGAYVYKPVEYMSQCSKTFNCEERRINDSYVFIGDILNHLWPMR